MALLHISDKEHYVDMDLFFLFITDIESTGFPTIYLVETDEEIYEDVFEGMHFDIPDDIIEEYGLCDCLIEDPSRSQRPCVIKGQNIFRDYIVENMYQFSDYDERLEWEEYCTQED